MVTSKWKEEVLKAIGIFEAYPADWILARRIVIVNKPEFLYRYRSGHDKDLDALKEGYDWLSRPDDYNDPHDARIFHGYGAASIPVVNKAINEDSTIRDKLRPLIGEEKLDIYGERADFQLLSIARRNLGSNFSLYKKSCIGLGEIFKKYSDEIESKFENKMRSRTNICSYTTKSDNYLMWSHYANSHKGYCIEYFFEEVNQGAGFIFPVLYRCEPIDVTELLKKASAGVKGSYVSVVSGSALVKSISWEYEDEWRYTGVAQNENRKLKMLKTRRVILGCNADPILSGKLINICKEKGIKVSRKIRSKSSYDMVDEEHII